MTDTRGFVISGRTEIRNLRERPLRTVKQHFLETWPKGKSGLKRSATFLLLWDRITSFENWFPHQLSIFSTLTELISLQNSWTNTSLAGPLSKIKRTCWKICYQNSRGSFAQEVFLPVCCQSCKENSNYLEEIMQVSLSILTLLFTSISRSRSYLGLKCRPLHDKGFL